MRLWLDRDGCVRPGVLVCEAHSLASKGCGGYELGMVHGRLLNRTKILERV